MPLQRFFYFAFLLSAIVSCKSEKVVTSKTTSLATVIEAESVFTVGSVKYDSSNFEQILDSYLITDTSKFEEIIDEILFQKRLYLEASSKGYADNQSLEEEINSYLGIVAQSFTQDTSIVNNLARITYERMKQEVNASHILIPISEFASPEDTLSAYKKALSYKIMAEQGVPFDSLAMIHSGDINTKNNGGEMGWFSALQLLYPLENTAYKTNIGQISEPVKSKAGYHIVKVNETRAYSGKAIVKHILKSVPKNSEVAFESFQKHNIDSLYNLINQGVNFDTLCLRNSDDPYSKTNGGLLESFSIGSRKEKSFESTAFNLKPGQVSKPVRTDVGWHLIKMVDKQNLEPFDKIEPWILKKITTDSRGEYLKELSIDKYKNQLQIQEYNDVFNDILKTVNKDIIDRNWKINKSNIKLQVLLVVAGESYTNLDFYRYAEDKQTFEKQFEDFTPDMYLRLYYKDFKTSKIEEAILKNLSKWNKDFAALANSYKENLVNSNYLNKEIYEKSVSDSLGIRQFYNTHISKYQLPKRAKATILETNNKELLQKYFETTSTEPPYRLKRGILPIYFDKNETVLTDDIKKKLAGLSIIMDNNPSYVVEIGGHRDVNEEVNISYSRIQEVVSFLKKDGLGITRIREYDYGTSRLSDRFDWTQNQKVSFQFFSTNKSDVARIFNTESDSLIMTQGEFYKGENAIIDGTAWELGAFEANSDKTFYRIEIEAIHPARTKTLKEAFGSVVSDYQLELKEQLKKQLVVKYPAELNRKELLKLYTDYKKKNL